MFAPKVQSNVVNHFQGVLLGTAVGDSLGLPAEGLTPQRIKRRWSGSWKHRFILGRGMISDDTEHSLFVAQALLTHPDDAVAFQRCLGWKLRWWLLGLPAGIGFATLRSILKLWLGFGPRRSGVWSAGNGPAMRSAIIGAYFANEPEKMKEYAEASTRMTHTDPKALIGALAVAQVTAWNIQHPNEPGQTLCLLKEMDGDPDWKAVMGKLEKAFREGRSVAEFAGKLGLEKGVSGYVYHSVPVAVFAVLRHPTDFRGALEAVFNCGGDTDTVGAIAGAILGASVCKQGIPQDWIGGIADWPRSCALLEKVSDRLVEQKRSGRALGPVGYFWPALILRNLIFLFTVLAHGFKRLAPPY